MLTINNKSNKSCWKAIRFSLLLTSHNILNNKKIKFLCIIIYLGSTNGLAKPLTMFRHDFSNDSTNDTSPLLLKAMTLSFGLGGYRVTGGHLVPYKYPSN